MTWRDDRGKATARGAVAAEAVEAVGVAECAGRIGVDACLGEARPNELRAHGLDEIRVVPWSMHARCAHARREVRVRERVGDLGPDLEVPRRDARAHGRDEVFRPRAGGAKRLDRARHDARDDASPAGVHRGHRARARIGEEDGHAVGDAHEDGGAARLARDRIGLAARRARRDGVDDRASVHLARVGDGRVAGQSRGRQEAGEVLDEVGLGVVRRTSGPRAGVRLLRLQVERSEGRGRDPAESRREGVREARVGEQGRREDADAVGTRALVEHAGSIASSTRPGAGPVRKPGGTRYPPRMNRDLRALVASLAVASSGLLAACSDNTGGYPPAPPAFEPPAAQLEAAKDPKFKPLAQALLAQRRASNALAEFRATVGGQMTEADQKTYGELFAKVASAGERVGALIAEANFGPDDSRTWEMIVSLDDATLESIAR